MRVVKINYLISAIKEPNYFYQGNNHSLEKINYFNNKIFFQITRIFQNSLPFITLYQPTKLPVMIVIEFSRTINCLFTLNDSNNQKNNSKTLQKLIRIAILISSLTFKFYASPVGMLISMSQDLITDAFELMEALKDKEYQKAYFLILNIINHALYLSLFFSNASQIVIASLSVQILLGLTQSYKNFRDEKYLEGFSQLLMACIRGNQLKAEVAILRLQHSINQHLIEVEKASKANDYLAEEQNKSVLNEESGFLRDLNLSSPLESGLSEKEILTKAEKYFENLKIDNKRPDLNLSSILSSSASDEEIIDALLTKQQGFCVGENHNHDSARAFLIKNMDYLKSKNIKMLFAEGWDYGSQKLIDKYFSVQHLRELESSDLLEVQNLLHHSRYHLINKTGSPYTNLALMEKAKKCGIRLVGIDYKQEKNIIYHSSQSYIERQKKLNFVAAHVIQANLKTMHSNEKFVVLVGAAHLRKTNEKLLIEGIADITKTQEIWIQDKNHLLPKDFPSLWYAQLDNQSSKSLPVNILLRESSS